MNISANGLALLKMWEGSRLKVYNDAAGLPTIGVGHLLTRSELASGKILIGNEWVRYAGGLTEGQVLVLLARDLEPAENAVNRKAKFWAGLNQNQFDALVSFTFNVGVRAFENSTLVKVLNAGDYRGVPEQLRRWNRAGGRVVKGLIKRRENEINLWESP